MFNFTNFQTTSLPKAYTIIVLGAIVAILGFEVMLKLCRYINFRSRLLRRRIKYASKGRTSFHFSKKNITKNVISYLVIATITACLSVSFITISSNMIGDGINSISHHDELVTKEKINETNEEVARQKRAKVVDAREEKKREAFAKREGARMWKAYQEAQEKAKQGDK